MSATQDAVVIRDLRVPARVGVTEQERAEAQILVVQVDIALDLGPSAASDELTDTLDYAQVVAGISEAVAAKPAKLLEHMAGEIASYLLGYESVAAVTVEVAKAAPPLEQDVGSVGVRIRRQR